MYFDMVLGFYGYFFLFLNCLVGCLSMIVWTPAVSGVLYACVLKFCICTCSAQLSMFHMERCSLLLLLLSSLTVFIYSVTTYIPTTLFIYI